MKRFAVSALVLAAALCCGHALAAGGGASDPLVSLSYLVDTVRDAIVSRAETETEKKIGEQVDSYIQRLDNSANFQSSDMSHSDRFTEMTLDAGMQLELGHFACFMPSAGKLVLRVEEGDVIDISKGETVADGTLMKLNHKYFAAENSKARVVAYSSGAAGFVDGYYKTSAGNGFGNNDMFYDLFGHWGAEYAYELYNKGVVNGVDEHRFAPDATVTRGMLVTVLGRVYGVNTNMYSQAGFSDVDISQWYGPYVAWARENGIVDGYDDGTFKPEANITREQMALIFMRFAEYAGIALPEGEATAFADEQSISSWALDAVIYAQRTGLMNGKDGNRFDPAGTATRAELCAVTSRIAAKSN